MPGRDGQPLRDDAHYLAKREPEDSEMLACEAVLASGLKEFLAELVAIDGTVMVSLICNEQHANLDDIIGSSMEHFVRPERLTYAHRAEVDFDWGRAPSVALGMELKDHELTAFFDVVLAGDHVGINIQGIHFVGEIGDAARNLSRFAAAVASAQLARPKPAGRRAGGGAAASLKQDWVSKLPPRIGKRDAR